MTNVVGLDSNILSYALDSAFPEHKETSSILENLSLKEQIAVNSTVIYETYHTLVRKQKWLKEDAAERLTLLMRQKDIIFLN